MTQNEKRIIMRRFLQAQKFLDEQKEVKKQIANDRFPMLPTMYHRAVGAFTEMMGLIKELGLSDYAIDSLLDDDYNPTPYEKGITDSIEESWKVKQRLKMEEDNNE